MFGRWWFVKDPKDAWFGTGKPYNKLNISTIEKLNAEDSNSEQEGWEEY